LTKEMFRCRQIIDYFKNVAKNLYLNHITVILNLFKLKLNLFKLKN